MPNDSRAKSYFLELFKAYYGKVVAYACFYLHDEAQAQNIAQDVFMAVWSNIDIIREPALPYLITITKRKCLNLLRTQKNRTIYENEINSTSLTYTALDNSAIETLLEKDVLDIIKRSLDLVPPLSKDAFLLHRKDGMSYKEIAQKQRVSQKVVEHRILSTLRIIRINIDKFTK